MSKGRKVFKGIFQLFQGQSVPGMSQSCVWCVCFCPMTCSHTLYKTCVMKFDHPNSNSTCSFWRKKTSLGRIANSKITTQALCSHWSAAPSRCGIIVGPCPWRCQRSSTSAMLRRRSGELYRTYTTSPWKMVYITICLLYVWTNLVRESTKQSFISRILWVGWNSAIHWIHPGNKGSFTLCVPWSTASLSEGSTGGSQGRLTCHWPPKQCWVWDNEAQRNSSAPDLPWYIPRHLLMYDVFTLYIYLLNYTQM